MGYFVASCIVTFSVLGVYGLILFVKSRRLSKRLSEGGFSERD